MDSYSALWRRLDRPGHDAALLTRTDSGWVLFGTAVFKHPDGPACVTYSVDLDMSWGTRSGGVRGFIGNRCFEHRIRRVSSSWYLNDTLIGGLNHLTDLDYGFTPATNYQQLRKLSLDIGQAADLNVAWFDVDAFELTELPQRYERRGESKYWYAAPSVPYEAVIEVGATGFISRYPSLWRMES